LFADALFPTTAVISRSEKARYIAQDDLRAGYG
jgi:hypothetical protein